MINLIELNKQKKYIETKQALEALKVEIVEVLTEGVKTIKNLQVGSNNL